MAENKNNFDTTVASLFKGMDSFVSAKTVVGDAVTVNDTIILPLVDVSFGVGAGAFAGEKKNSSRQKRKREEARLVQVTVLKRFVLTTSHRDV